MTIFRHKKLEADPEEGKMPFDTELTCEIYSSKKESTVDVTYSLAPEHRYWFELAGGVVTKRFTDPDRPVSSDPTEIAKDVSFVSRDSGESPVFFFVTATLVEDRSGSRIRTSAAITPL